MQQNHGPLKFFQSALHFLSSPALWDVRKLGIADEASEQRNTSGMRRRCDPHSHAAERARGGEGGAAERLGGACWTERGAIYDFTCAVQIYPSIHLPQVCLVGHIMLLSVAQMK